MRNIYIPGFCPNNLSGAVQSKDADPEKFFGKLKDRMQRYCCVWLHGIVSLRLLTKLAEVASSKRVLRDAGHRLTLQVWKSDSRTWLLMLTLLLEQGESQQC